MANRKKPLVIVTRKLPDRVETRMRELFDARLNVEDRPMTQPELVAAVKESAGAAIPGTAEPAIPFDAASRAVEVDRRLHLHDRDEDERLGDGREGVSERQRAGDRQPESAATWRGRRIDRRRLDPGRWR